MNSPFLRVSPQRDVRLAGVSSGLRRVLCAIKDVDLTHHSLGRDQVGVLRHVARAVDFAGVVDRLNDLDTRFRRLVCTNFCYLVQPSTPSFSRSTTQ
jgi:hypothetical protein